MPQRPSFFVHWVFFVLNSQMKLFIYYNHGFTFAQICAEFFKIFIYSFIYFLSCTGSLLLRRFFSSCGEEGRHSYRRCVGFSLWRLLLLQRMGSRASGPQLLWLAGLVAQRHVGSSWTRDGIPVSCIGRRILHHWAMREACSSSLEWMCRCMWISASVLHISLLRGLAHYTLNGLITACP